MQTCILGGSDINPLELTVLSSGVRLYISCCVVLYNDPQWRTHQRNTVTRWGRAAAHSGDLFSFFCPSQHPRAFRDLLI